jgi:hypothetical protein
MISAQKKKFSIYCSSFLSGSMQLSLLECLAISTLSWFHGASETVAFSIISGSHQLQINTSGRPRRPNRKFSVDAPFQI